MIELVLMFPRDTIKVCVEDVGKMQGFKQDPKISYVPLDEQKVHEYFVHKHTLGGD